jgi:antitoxin (DNA-binding transcriptional repressor) of toxin-antitoxin stability system
MAHSPFSDNLNIMSAAKKITASEAARSFSDVVARVHYRGEEFVVEKGGVAVCRISPVGQGAPKSTLGDLLGFLDSMPPVDDGFKEVVLEATRKQPKLPRSPWE